MRGKGERRVEGGDRVRESVRESRERARERAEVRECAAQVSTAQVSTAQTSSAQLAAAQASSAHVEWLKWEKWLVAQVSAANLYITLLFD